MSLPATDLTLTIAGRDLRLLPGHLSPLVDEPVHLRTAAAQARLLNLGYGVDAIDGHLRPNTRSLLRAFRREHNLAPDDTLDAETATALRTTHGR